MYLKQILIELKEELDNIIIILGDFNTPLWTLDRSSKQKIYKETIDLNTLYTNWILQLYIEHSIQQ